MATYGKQLSVTACVASLTLLSGCIAFPPMAPKPVGNEHYLTCSQLDNSLSEAQGYFRQAEAEDRFRLSYIFPPSGALSVWNIMRAKSRAKERMEYIQQVQQMKQCASGSSGSQGGGYPSPNMPSGYNAMPQGDMYAPPPYQADGYSAPQQGYGMPPQNYGAPQGYGMPQQGY